MRIFSVVLLFLLSASQAAAQAACATPAPVAAIPQMPPLLPGGGIQSYYCSASPAIQTVGDLTPADWAKHVQVCTTNCFYEPVSPGDAQSRLMPVGCGPGWHNPVYLVEPPRPTVTVKTGLVDSCKGLVPSKAADPAPTPHRGRAMR